jgi:hypothetical protein
MSILSLQSLIKKSLKLPSRYYLRRVIVGGILLMPIMSLADNHFSAWSDKTICRLVQAQQDNAEYQSEAKQRGLNCGSSGTTLTTSNKITPWSHSANQNENALFQGPRWTGRLRSMYNSDFPTWHVTADMNNDGILDFVYSPFFDVENTRGSGKVAHGAEDDSKHGHCLDEVCRGDGVLPSIYFGRSDGTWIYGTGAVIDNRELPGYRMGHVVVADFNGDGRQDMFINDTMDDEGSGPNGVKEWNGHRDSYYLSQADGTWLESSDTHLSIPDFQVFDHGKVVGDIDGDGDNDIVITTSEGHSYCWKNNGKGYMKLDKYCARGITAFVLELADMDGDGDLDLISSHSEQDSRTWAGKTAIHYNNGKGRFRKNSVPLKMYISDKYDWSGILSIKAADFDNDGDLDLVLTRFREPYVGLALEIKENLGGNKFGSSMHYIYDIPNYTKEKHDSIKSEGNVFNVAQLLRIADANDDGLLDIITYAGHGLYKDYVYMNDGDMTFTEHKAHSRPTLIDIKMSIDLKVNDRFYMEDMY